MHFQCTMRFPRPRSSYRHFHAQPSPWSACLTRCDPKPGGTPKQAIQGHRVFPESRTAEGSISQTEILTWETLKRFSSRQPSIPFPQRLARQKARRQRAVKHTRRRRQPFTVAPNHRAVNPLNEPTSANTAVKPAIRAVRN